MARVILASIGEAVIATDQAGRINTLNAEAEHLTGWTQEQALGLPISNVFRLVDLDRRTPIECPAAAAMRDNRPIRVEVDALLVSRDGREFIVEVSAAPVRDDDTDPRGAVLICRDVSDTRHLQRCIAWQAGHDALTHLPNRNLLTDRLRQAIAHALREKTLLAVCYIDLDGFKPINDRYGHEIGDRILVSVAERLTAMIRGSDTVARIGGDEFVLLLSGADTPTDFQPVLERLVAEIAAPYNVDNRQLSISASIGVAICPLDDSDPDTILRHADQAMYYAKQTGRNRYQLFDSDYDRKLGHHREELVNIRHALAENQFVLHYQPKVNIRTGQIIGAEALLRWQHPEDGLIQLNDIMATIAHTDITETLDHWVIDAVLRQMTDWSKQGMSLPISVNVSPDNLQRPDFVAQLSAALAAQPQVSPSLLELEVVESVAIDDPDRIRHVIEACHDLGVTFSLDDFGTGYSCLANLRSLPVDGLKIDQSFVRDMLDDSNDLAIVEGVIGLAQVFQSHVIAEGVETTEHAIMLMRLGCDIVQGYGIARPMPPDELRDWIRRFKPDPRWSLWADTHWELTDFPLLVAQYDHVRWVKNVVMSIDQPVGRLDENEVMDKHTCRFGHWYDHHGRQHYGEMPEFLSLDELHNRVHEIGGRMMSLHREGRTAEARQLSPTLLNLKDDILAQLHKLQIAVSHHHSAQR
ncbi:MAG: EAL domain-containing protein [Gammaproteobacteria bacterium]|nr:EAL domain-containing protein [Gammaproteobacteria bacterium]MBU1416607.1 EAL domain-containing protein [Gammaproteobacteria bacterium]